MNYFANSLPSALQALSSSFYTLETERAVFGWCRLLLDRRVRFYELFSFTFVLNLFQYQRQRRYRRLRRGLR